MNDIVVQTRFGPWTLERLVGVVALVSATVGFVAGLVAALVL